MVTGVVPIKKDMKNEKKIDDNSDKSLRIQRSIDKSQRIHREILCQIPVSVKEEFLLMMSNLHHGHVSRYQSLEVNNAIKLAVESWMSRGEKPKTGFFSLPTNSCPKPNILAKLIMLSEIAKIQPPFPKFSMKGLLFIAELTFSTGDRKTLKKFADYLKTLSDTKLDQTSGIQADYNLENFCKFMDRMKSLTSKEERDSLWANHFGYKFSAIKNAPSHQFQKNEKLTSIHARVDSQLKENFDTIIREKYSGRKRQAFSYEISAAISAYTHFINSSKKLDHVRSAWDNR